MKFLSVHFSPSSSYFVSNRSRYFP